MPFPSFDNYANFSATTVATAPSPATTGTSITVAASTGAILAGGGVPCDAVVWPSGAQPTDTNAEVVRITAISGDTATVTRNTTVGTFNVTTTINSASVTLANGSATVPASGTFYINGQAFGPGCILTVNSTTTGTLSQVALASQSAVASRIGIVESGGVNRSIVVGDNIAANVTLKALTDLQNAVHLGGIITSAITTSSTSASPATALSFNVAANQSYRFYFGVQAVMSNTSTTPGEFVVAGPTGATIAYDILSPSSTRGATGGVIQAAGIAFATTSGQWINLLATTQTTPLQFLGHIQAQTTAGTCALQFAVSTAGVTCTVQRGSFTAFRVA